VVTKKNGKTEEEYARGGEETAGRGKPLRIGPTTLDPLKREHVQSFIYNQQIPREGSPKEGIL